MFVGAALPQAIIMGLRPGDSILLWVGLGGVLVGVLAGSTVALRIVNRFR